MGIRAFVGVKVTDKDGRVMFYRRWKSHSFLSNFMAILLAQMIEVYNWATVRRENGNQEYIRYDAASFWSNASGNDDTFGIVVGSGDAPVAPGDYKLANKILHGNSSGKLEYKGMQYSYLQVDGSRILFHLTRQFNNFSGGTITIKETGIFAYYMNSAGSRYKTLIIRDVLPTGVNVENNSFATIDYTIEVKV